ncbi:hypothetical protein MKW94_010874 [Papaver nudicaule]|uniref:Mechanosensitive ion channel protein n=1 Tax=Papaver nudicaule TaxID=74823 RepID=A0AA42AYA6_PAPNU|nr:hypothetical protein [Papaver nudicaule]
MEGKEVLVKIDENGSGDIGTEDDESSHGGNRFWRGSSYAFGNDKNNNSSGGGGEGRPSLSAIEEIVFVQEQQEQQQQQQQQQQSERLRDDPPTKLIDQFLNLHQASGEVSLDMDLEMEELVHEHKNNTPSLPFIGEDNSYHGPPPPLPPPPPPPPPKPSFPATTSPTLIKTASQPIPQTLLPQPVKRRLSKGISLDENYSINLQQPQQFGSESPHFGGGGDEVLKCTSNDSFKRSSNSSLQRTSNSSSKKKTYLRTKTMKSRLTDPPADGRSGRLPAKSVQLKSGFIPDKSSRLMEDDEEDPFARGEQDDDIPDKYKLSEFFSPLIILEWVSLILILSAFVCSLTIHRLRKRTPWALPLWKWELILLVLICGRLVSGWGIRIVVFFIERNFLLRRKVLYFVYGLRRAVQNCLWLGLVLLAWQYLLDEKVEKDIIKDRTRIPIYITKFLILLLVSTLLWLVKTLIVKVLASSFHVTTYFDRIQDSLFTQYVIETLSGPPIIEIERDQEEEEQVMAEVQNLQNAGCTMPADLIRKTCTAPKPIMKKSGRVIGSGMIQDSPPPHKVKSGRKDTPTKKLEKGITVDELHKLNQKNISAWKMKRLMNIIRHGVITTVDEHIRDSCDEEESSTTIRSELEAKSAARKIFNNVAKPYSKFIHLDDILRFMREEEAEKTMNQFEGAIETDRISKKSMKNWVVNAFRERRALALTLDDTKTAVKQLHTMVNFVVGILIVIIGLVVLEIATTKFLVLISSQLLLVAFMFGNTCKMVFEAIIFLFVMHPFDVGDRCEVEDVQMVVEEMNILTTVFLRYDNQKIIYPNSVLATKPISNMYRSPDQGEAIDFCIHVSTPMEKISTMKLRLTEFIESKREHWYPAPMIVVRDVDDLNRLKISVWFCHRMNFQDMGMRFVRRALVVEEMIKVLRELDMEYRMLPLDINVRNMPGFNSQRLPSNWNACNNN